MLRSNIALICVLAFSSTALWAQETLDADREKFNIGFILGANHSFLEQNEPSPNLEITNHSGFELGIGAEFRLFKGLYAAPSMMMMMGGADVNFANQDLRKVYEVMPFSLGFNANFQYKFLQGNNQPYMILGAKYDLSLNKAKNTTEFSNGNNFGLNFGLGMSHWFKSFMLAPELVYSHGLSNINDNPIISVDAGLYLHQISLRFKFMD